MKSPLMPAEANAKGSNPCQSRRPPWGRPDKAWVVCGRAPGSILSYYCQQTQTTQQPGQHPRRRGAGLGTPPQLSHQGICGRTNVQRLGAVGCWQACVTVCLRPTWAWAQQLIWGS